MGMHVIASSHVDMAWKKNREEMKDLFESMIVRILDMMGQTPDFTLAVEQAAHFRQLAETRQDLVDRVRRYVREGRIEVVGGMATTLETLFEEADKACQEDPLLVMPYVENEVLPNNRMIQAVRQRADPW